LKKSGNPYRVLKRSLASDSPSEVAGQGAAIPGDPPPVGDLPPAMPSNPCIVAGWLSLILLIMATTSVSGVESPPAEELIFFESHIRPLLVKHCLEGHAGDDPKGGVDLSSRSGWMDSGVIRVGASHSSLLLEVVRSKDDDSRMPSPSKASSSPRELETLSQWIDRGSVDPCGSMAGEEDRPGAMAASTKS
jgi:hypothetical protein